MIRFPQPDSNGRRDYRHSWRIILHQDEMIIADFKYGKGVLVSVKNNTAIDDLRPRRIGRIAVCSGYPTNQDDHSHRSR